VAVQLVFHVCSLLPSYSGMKEARVPLARAIRSSRVSKWAPLDHQRSAILAQPTFCRPASWASSCSSHAAIATRGFSAVPNLVGSPMQRYKALIAAGQISKDERQERTVQKLDELAKKVTNYSPSRRTLMEEKKQSVAAPKTSGGFFGGLFGGGAPKAAAKKKEPPRIKPTGPMGLYVFGSCGTGKTFLMDLFYEAVSVQSKRRIHFHEWMIDVHERLHRLQKKNAMVKEKANTVWTAEAAMAQRKELKNKKQSTGKQESADDLVAQVANEMMNEGWLLCFDEFQVTHISDAIIMKRLFSILWQQGAVVIATSNRPPEDLYLNGLNRPLFLPFIPMLREFCNIHDINSDVDYRLTTTGEEEDRRVYIFPNDNEAFKSLERKFYRLAKGEVLPGAQVETQGRRIVVPKIAANSGVAWFKFKDLCDKPLGAADYLAVANAFHTVFVCDIPTLTLQERDQVRRFITMIDAFYERHTKLVCTADREPYTLFSVKPEEKENSTFDEIFAWDRTVSRLIEMQSVKYLGEHVKNMDGEQFLAQYNFMSLSDDDLKDMWRRYDRDDSGDIDKHELRILLEDLLEKHRGHRHLSDETWKCCFENVDLDKDGVVSFTEFETYLKDFRLVASTLQIGSATIP